MPQEPNKKESDISDQDVSKMLKKMHRLQDNLQKKFESLLDRTGKSLEEVDTFHLNRENFSDKEWNRIQKHRKELENKVLNVLGKGVKKVRKKKEKVKGDKKRRGKTLGSRKGWMKM